MYLWAITLTKPQRGDHVAERKRAETKTSPETGQPSPTPQSPYPAETPPDEAQTRGASNQTGQLPHNAAAGCARAAAWFERIMEATGTSTEAHHFARTALEDVSRFVPDAMRQAARDEVAR